MGGQACVLYGAAEFSRDTDLAILASDENLSRLRAALDDLRAERIAVPPFEKRFLDMGLAVHFRCGHEECPGLRIDVMSQMRGARPFAQLWQDRTTIELDDGAVDVLSLPDLVAVKKTQRDKDWPMIARLVEANYFSNRGHPNDQQVRFWLRELRTPTLLMELARTRTQEAETQRPHRPLLDHAIAQDEPALMKALRDEQEREAEADRLYWAPLRSELERLRRAERGRP